MNVAKVKLPSGKIAYSAHMSNEEGTHLRDILEMVTVKGPAFIFKDREFARNYVAQHDEAK